MKRLLKVILKIATIAIFLLLIAVAAPALFGYQRFIITGGSMTGTIAKGSISFSKATSSGSLKKGDIITFQTPAEYGSKTVTHRIINIAREQNGQKTFRTKGDFNPQADPWKIQFPNGKANRYQWHIPVVGYALAQTANPRVRTFVVVLPALFLGLSFLWSIAQGIRKPQDDKDESDSFAKTSDNKPQNPNGSKTGKEEPNKFDQALENQNSQKAFAAKDNKSQPNPAQKNHPQISPARSAEEIYKQKT